MEVYCLSVGCACVFIGLVHVLETGFKGTIRQCTFSFLPRLNGNDATRASQLPLWLASCVPPVRWCSFRLPLSSLCSHAFHIFLLSSPPFLFSPLFSSKASTASLPLQNKNKERGGGWRLSLSGYVSCLRMLLKDISGRSEPTINPLNIAQSKNPEGT